jgi:hypothetical protein
MYLFLSSISRPLSLQRGSVVENSYYDMQYAENSFSVR